MLPVVVFGISTLIALGVRQVLLRVLAGRMPANWRGKICSWLFRRRA